MEDLCSQVFRSTANKYCFVCFSILMRKKQIQILEQVRDKLTREIAAITAQHSDKLLYNEARIAELMEEVTEKEREIQGLREGMQEMRLMYRAQLDELLEEKAAAALISVPNNVQTVVEDEEATSGGDILEK